MKKFLIGQDEKAVLYRNKIPLRILEPRTEAYRFWRTGYHVKTWHVSDPFLADDGVDAKVLGALDWAASELVTIKVNALERAIVWEKGRVYRILETGEYLYWQGLRDLTVEIVSVKDPVFKHARLTEVVRFDRKSQFLDALRVAQGSVGILFLESGERRELQPGTYALWKNAEPYQLQVQELRMAQLSVAGQELMTKDNVTLRINLDVSYQVTDVNAYLDVAENAQLILYNRSQLALREAVGGQTLDCLLAEKDALSKELFTMIAEAAKDLGMTVSYAGVRDIILPGDLREILNQVIAAKKNAEANVIKRREETASTRSQLNTAKLIESNPIMMRLREIEAMQEIMQKVGNVTMFDGLAGLLDGVKLTKTG